ncbi:histidine kinase [Lysinibacillus contaminans]|uniref:histidine kinase n=2 Tax=Lysinibacillus contaminans TaxID=1293441 RepID=A0ABR5JYL1_9BACI|nr:histidine kinase [Lysinibacillus contaminans]
MKNISLRLKMFIFSFIIVISSIATSGAIMIHNLAGAFEKEFGARAIAIARTVSQLSDIQNNIGTEEGFEKIQPIAERIRLATDVDYIVVIDMNRIRYSHPSESKLGTVFEGGDEVEAFSQHEYISKARGVLGYSIRAFVPIMNEESTRQVGVITVGLLSPKWYSLLDEYQYDILMSLFWGLAIGLGGSVLVANHLKRQTFNLEPYEIARLVEERSGIIQAMDIGILATDEHGNVTFINRLARQYTHFFGQTISRKTLFKDTWLAEDTIQQYEAYRPLLMYEQMYLVRTISIRIMDQSAGYLIMLTDRKEANMLAEELTGIKMLVDSLRAQQHEYMNRLHSIAGLIQLERNDDALSLIIDEITDEEEIIQSLRDKIYDYSIQGLMLGKYSRAKELGIELTIDEDSKLVEFMSGFSSGDMVTIIGNLLDNAMEACLECVHKDVHLTLIGDKHHLFIEVQDSGKGVQGIPQRIFDYGFSTKQKEGRGIGLALIKQIVESNNGTIQVESTVQIGTTITIKVGVTEE